MRQRGRDSYQFEASLKGLVCNRCPADATGEHEWDPSLGYEFSGERKEVGFAFERPRIGGMPCGGQ